MHPRQVERIQWTVLTVFGLIAGLALGLPLGIPIFAVIGAMAGTPVVLSIVGLSLGTAQWPIIRRYLSPSWSWVAFSALGTAIGLTLGVTLVEQIGRAVMAGPVNFRSLGIASRALSFGTIGLLGGASLGLTQWLVLRRQVPRCKRWIAVNAWSLGAGLASGSLLADTFAGPAGSFASIAILLVTGGGVAGLCTARALAMIFTPRRESI
jgi:hypothetical protein